MTLTEPAVQDRLLSLLDPIVRAFARRGALRSYARSTVIVQEGDQGDSTYVLLQGREQVYSTDIDGREITYDVVQAADLLACMWPGAAPRPERGGRQVARV